MSKLLALAVVGLALYALTRRREDDPHLSEWTQQRIREAEQATRSYLGDFRVRDGDWRVWTSGRRPTHQEIIEDRERRAKAMQAPARVLKLAKRA